MAESTPLNRGGHASRGHIIYVVIARGSKALATSHDPAPPPVLKESGASISLYRI